MKNLYKLIEVVDKDNPSKLRKYIPKHKASSKKKAKRKMVKKSKRINRGRKWKWKF